MLSLKVVWHAVVEGDGRKQGGALATAPRLLVMKVGG